MKNKYLQFLRSPLTRDILELNDSKLIDKSGNKFPIINGIPRFVDITNYAESFGFQWNIFSEVQLDKKNNYDISSKRLYDNVNLKKNDFEGKMVLELGSGAGRFTEVLLKENCDLFCPRLL